MAGYPADGVAGQLIVYQAGQPYKHAQHILKVSQQLGKANKQQKHLKSLLQAIIRNVVDTVLSGLTWFAKFDCKILKRSDSIFRPKNLLHKEWNSVLMRMAPKVERALLEAPRDCYVLIVVALRSCRKR